MWSVECGVRRERGDTDRVAERRREERLDGGLADGDDARRRVAPGGHLVAVDRVEHAVVLVELAHGRRLGPQHVLARRNLDEDPVCGATVPGVERGGSRAVCVKCA